MAGEIDVIPSYTGVITIDGVAQTFTDFKLTRKTHNAHYKTGGDGGFRRSTKGRSEGEFTFRVPCLPDDGPTLGVLYSFALVLGVTEGGDSILVPAFDARVNEMVDTVNSEEDDKIVYTEYKAEISGVFTLARS